MFEKLTVNIMKQQLESFQNSVFLAVLEALKLYTDYIVKGSNDVLDVLDVFAGFFRINR